MDGTIKNTVKVLTPPLLWNAASFLKKAAIGLFAPRIGRSESPSEADAHYKNQRGFFQQHYSESPYYFLWCVAADRLVRRREWPILEIGCGAGQLAAFLCDKGIEGYLGIDFSVEAVALAKEACPKFSFRVENICETNTLDAPSYRTVVTLEVLEHIENDLELLKRIRPGVRVLASVPSFPSRFHVRHFGGCEEVAVRYGGLFDEFRVDAFACFDGKQHIYLVEGIRRE